MKKINYRELTEKFQANADRIKEIADACETEQRDRTEQEEDEYRSLSRENEVIRMRMKALDADLLKAEAVDADAQLRDALKAGRKVTYRLTRAVQTTAALADTGIIPTKQEDMLAPLRAGLIYDKVGLNIATGLVGKLRWPSHTKAVASWADEAAALTDSSIDFDKLEMSGVRMGIAIPVTKEELNDSEGIVERVIREEMPKAIADLVNAALFTTVGTGKKVVGPFVEAAKTANITNFAAALPTRKELRKLVAKVSKAGIKFIAPCWVMAEDMKAELEDIKIDAGSGRFLCENDRIFGYPVFTSEAIEAGYIGFGDWSYQASGFFGSMEVVVDPYTLARKNAVDFVLNGRFGTVTLRPEAFVVGKVKSE